MNPLPTSSSFNLYLNFQEVADRYPTHRAMQIKEGNIWRHWTFKELEAAIEKYAATLEGIGVHPGDRVILISDNRPEAIITFFAIFKCQATAVPVDIAVPNLDLELLVHRGDVKFLLCSDAALGLIEPDILNAHVVRNLQHNLAEVPGYRSSVGSHPAETSDADPDMAFILFTSGTSGTSKGVCIAHKGLLADIKAGILALEIKETDRIFYMLPIHHIGPISAILGTIFAGGCAHFLSKIDVDLLLSELQEVKPTIFLVVPRLLDLFWAKISSQTENLPPIKRAMFKGMLKGSNFLSCKTGCDIRPLLFGQIHRKFGGKIEKFVSIASALGSKTQLGLESLGFTILQLYGLTEASGATATNRMDSQRLGSCGFPVEGVSLKIESPDNAGVGEICVSGPMVMQGYFRDPEATRNAIREGWYHTGDLGRIDPEGYLFITGRARDIIVTSGGKKSAPQDIEKHYVGIEGVEDFAVFGISNRENTAHEIYMAVAISQDTAIQQIQDKIYEKGMGLPFQMRVQHVHVVDAIPRTSTKKVKRYLLRERLTPQYGDKVVAPMRVPREKPNNREEISRVLASWVANQIEEEENKIRYKSSFVSFGFDSLKAVECCQFLSEWLGIEVNPTLFWECPNIEKLAFHLAVVLGLESEEKTPVTNLSLDKAIYEQPLAIVGMGCRFPGKVNDPQSFLELLLNGGDAITEVPKDRWDIEEFYDIDPAKPGKMNTRYGGFIDNIAEFDASFFNISPIEAERMDPQHRILLETLWQAFEQANILPDEFQKLAVGVFIGACNNDYSRVLGSRGRQDISAYCGIGNALSALAGRISYFFNFRGPCETIDTACSSSLAALHHARLSIAAGECEAAIVGGVNAILTPDASISFSKAQMLAPDGHCKTFDAQADGYVRSEGCGVVLLKKVADAERDGDEILAVIKGTAVNQDGASNGLTAPSSEAQIALYTQALRRAQIEPKEVDYIEAHGTGTSLGDPIEMRSIAKVYSDGRHTPLRVGSVKTNLGHLESAAGMAGLLKVVLSLNHQIIPKHLHLNKCNPLIDLAKIPAEIPITSLKWTKERGARVAAVSSFGFTGTNAHVIVEEGPSKKQEKKKSVERPLHLLNIFGRTEEALSANLAQYEAFLRREQGPLLEDVAYTANTCRTPFVHRASIVAQDRSECAEKIKNGDHLRGIAVSRNDKPAVAFLFTGQGAQYAGMGHGLYKTQPIFTLAIDACAEILQNKLQDILFDPRCQAQLDQTQYTQPALFAVEYALARLWQSWGIQPDYVMGHSSGEYVAAVIAGVFTLEEGLSLLAERARLMGSLPAGGGMLAVMQDAAEVKELIAAHQLELDIAGLNAPRQTVVSGEMKEIDKLSGHVQCSPLTVSHAFHSRLMEPMLAEFKVIAEKVTYRSPKIELVSNLTGRVIQGDTIDANYWCSHIRHPVDFLGGVRWLAERRCEVFIEAGPHPVLLGMVDAGLRVPSLRKGRGEWETILGSLGALQINGVPIDWAGFDAPYIHQRQKVALPSYPFQRRRFWVDSPAPISSSSTYEIKWEKATQQPRMSQAPKTYYLLPGADRALIKRLEKDHHTVVVLDSSPSNWKLPSQQELEVLFIAGAQDLAGQERELKLMLDACHAIQNSGGRPTWWLFTENAEQVHPMQSALTGFLKVMLAEEPSWRGKQVDVENGGLEDIVDALVQKDDEDQIAYRSHERYVPRLQARSESEGTEILPDKTYLVTGGLGGLGFKLAENLVKRGAKNLVLTGRSEPGKEILEKIEQWKGLNIEVVRSDVSREEEVRELFQRIAQDFPPLGGVFHVAGVVEDAMIGKLNWDSFHRVLTPKIQGAWYLHEATRELKLDFFVLFSSVSSLFGTPSQSNYASANAFLDHLSLYRHQQGLPSLSINWGPWADVGMAKDLKAVHAALGVHQIPLEEGFDALLKGVNSRTPQLVVADVDWATFRSMTPRQPSLLKTVLGAPEPAVSFGLDTLKQGIKRRVAQVLGYDNIAFIDETKTFQSMGMDSLMGVQLHLLLQKDLSPYCSTADIDLFGSGSIEDLSKKIAGICFEGEASNKRWLQVLKSEPHSTITLFCFPHVGSDPASYVPWINHLPPGIEMQVVHLPGHVGRLDEQPPESIDAIVKTTLEALQDSGALEKPFVFFGHSMGTILAYEVTQALAQSGGRLPECLIVSASEAPHKIQKAFQDGNLEAVTKLHLESMFQEKGEQLKEIYLPIIERDLNVLRRYNFRSQPQLACPIYAMGGDDDPVYTEEGLAAWGELTKAGFRLDTFPGDHFYIMSQPEKAIECVEAFIEFAK